MSRAISFVRSSAECFSQPTSTTATCTTSWSALPSSTRKRRAGRHIITVDVIDENFNRIQGARCSAWVSWPTHRYPEFDERVQLTIFGSQLAELALYANFVTLESPRPLLGVLR